MDWKAVGERLIRRGELILDPESLGNHEKELEKMNKDRTGPCYKVADSYIQFPALVRCRFQVPYRQLQGYTRVLNRLILELSEADKLGHQEANTALTGRSLPAPQQHGRGRHHCSGLHRGALASGRFSIGGVGVGKKRCWACVMDEKDMLFRITRIFVLVWYIDGEVYEAFNYISMRRCLIIEHRVNLSPIEGRQPFWVYSLTIHLLQ